MDFCSVLPSEVVENIFKHLVHRDLVNCSLVCTDWYNHVNTNSIWLKVIKSKGIEKKPYLQDSNAVIRNPLKRLRKKSSMEHKCHWWAHYERYKFVEGNWELGHFSLTQTQIQSPLYVSKDYIVQLQSGNLNVHSMVNVMKPLCSIDSTHQGGIQGIVLKDDYLVLSYIKSNIRIITSYRKNKNENNFTNIFQHNFPSVVCVRSHSRNSQNSNELFLRLSNKYIIANEVSRPCTLHFLSKTTGNPEKQIDLHKTIGYSNSFSTSFLNVINEKIYIGYTTVANESFLIIYNILKEIWESPLQVNGEVMDIYFSENFFCAKLSIDDQVEFNDLLDSINKCYLHVWFTQTFVEAGLYLANERPSAVISNDKIIYSIRDEVSIRSLVTDFEQKVNVAFTISNLFSVWDRFVVLSDCRTISVWNWKDGKKLYTIDRSGDCSVVVVTDSLIMFKVSVWLEPDKYFVAGFW